MNYRTATLTIIRPIRVRVAQCKAEIAGIVARKSERDAELAGLIGAIDVLRRQRGVAIAIAAGAEHLAELDAEEAAYYARARALGAAWA